IGFGNGQFSPDSQAGGRLLAHELTHVIQQRGRRTPTIHKQPAGTTAPKPEPRPADSMRSNIKEMQDTYFPAFQKAVDDVSENGITGAGNQIATSWQRVEGNYYDVPALPSAVPASPDRPAAMENPPDVENDFKAARQSVLQAVSTQSFHGAPVLA